MLQHVRAWNDPPRADPRVHVSTPCEGIFGGSVRGSGAWGRRGVIVRARRAGGGLPPAFDDWHPAAVGIRGPSRGGNGGAPTRVGSARPPAHRNGRLQPVLL